MISNKILAIPDYEDVQEKIKIILDKSLLVSSKILLSDLAFKNGNFIQSYDLLKNNFEYPKQLLDFAYQNKKIDNYDLAIEVYQYIINQNYNSRITISAILEMADTFELKSIESKFQLPISQYFYNNQILVSPYHYVDTKNLKILNEAISLYDSLYTISKGSDAGFKLAGIKFAILKDLDGALDIYSDCVKYSNNQSIIFNSKLKIIDIWIAKGNLLEAITWSERIQTELNQLLFQVIVCHLYIFDLISQPILMILFLFLHYDDLRDEVSRNLAFRLLIRLKVRLQLQVEIVFLMLRLFQYIFCILLLLLLPYTAIPL